MPWNDVKCGKRPDPEIIRENADEYEKYQKKMKPLDNWYHVSVDELKDYPYIARVVCQRSNCWWDSAQRRQYASWIVRAVVMSSILVFAMALIAGGSIEDLILQAVVPMAPAWLLGIRQYLEQREAAERLDKLKDHCNSAWDAALKGMAAAELTPRSRALQDEIFESRRKAPPVLDFVFNRLRDRYEDRMKHAVDQYVADAKKALRIQPPDPPP